MTGRPASRQRHPSGTPLAFVMEAAPGESRAEVVIRAIVEMAAAGTISSAAATAMVVQVARPPGASC